VRLACPETLPALILSASQSFQPTEAVMFRFNCVCGKPLRVVDEYAGEKVRCPACGREVIATDSKALRQPAATTLSRKALFSLILGLLSFMCLFLTGLPAIILGLLGIQDVRRNRGQKTVTALAFAGILTGSLGTLASFVVLPVAFMLLSVATLFHETPLTTTYPTPSEGVKALPWVEERGVMAHIWGMRFSPDSRLFFGSGDAGPKGAIRIWDTATGNERPALLTGKDVWYSTAIFTPDGKHIVSCYSQDNAVYVWETATSARLGLLVGHTAPVVSLAVSPDSRVVLSGSQDRTLHLWTLAEGKQLHSFSASSENPRGVFSPDSKYILTFGDAPVLRLWDVASGSLVHELAGHIARCAGIFSTDGKQILSYSSDRTARLWEVANGKQTQLFEGASDALWGAVFLEDGRQVAAWGKDRSLRVWDADTGRSVRQLDLGKDWKLDLEALALSADGRRLLTTHEDQSLRLRDLPTGTELHRFLNVTNARGLAFSPDGRFAASGSFRAGVYLIQLPEAGSAHTDISKSQNVAAPAKTETTK
jgi:hypothetical protein